MRYPFILFDWGDTLMRDAPNMTTPMYQWDSVNAVDGAEQVLCNLHSQSTIALATGAALSDETDIWRTLRRVSIDSYIHKVYCFMNTGFRKPAPEFYRHVLRDLHANPSDALMVGDNFENDVLAANRVGIHAVWLNPKTNENRTGDLHWTIHSLSHLLPVLTSKEKM